MEETGEIGLIGRGYKNYVEYIYIPIESFDSELCDLPTSSVNRTFTVPVPVCGGRVRVCVWCVCVCGVCVCVWCVCGVCVEGVACLYSIYSPYFQNEHLICGIFKFPEKNKPSA